MNVFNELKPVKYRKAVISQKEKLFDRFKKEFPAVKRNIILKNYTTFKIGGPAEYFFIADKKEDLLNIIKSAKKVKLPIFVLGGGSNLLVSDKGVKGLVVKLNTIDLLRTGS